MITPREKRILEKNRNRFDALVRAIDSPVSQGDKPILALIQRVVDFAVQNDTGCFCSPEIEAKLCEIAKSIPDTDDKSFVQPGTILHVMTSAYKYGGHTRVVERWIANSSPEEIHSVILTDQEPMHFPSHIEELVKARGGQVLQLPPVQHTKKGAILRSWSLNASKIILHVHMYDLVPILAYGSPSFKVPVIFFNHADHLFWIGACITDLCADMSSWRCDFSRRRRGVSRSCLLPIPTDDGFVPIPREEARTLLGIAPEDRVIVTSAQDYKYGRYKQLDFFSFLLRITIEHPERIVLAIWPSKTHPLWELAQKASGGRIRPCGEIPYKDIGVYLCAADLYIESFPFPSFTSLLDVATLGIPTLSLRLPLPHLDSIEASGTICPTIDDLCHRIDAALLAPPSTASMIDAIKLGHRRDGWLTHLRALYSACPTVHQVTDLSTLSLDRSIGQLEAYLHYLKGNLRSDRAALLRRQARLLFELLRLMVRFSLFDISSQGVLFRHLIKSALLLFGTFPKIVSKYRLRNRWFDPPLHQRHVMRTERNARTTQI